MTLQNGADASPASENLDPTQTAPAVDGGTPLDANTPAQSSGADSEDAKQAEPEGLLDVVKSVVEPKPEASEDSSASEAKTEDGADAEKPGEGEAAEDQTDADVPFHKHPRWQEMKAERDAFKSQAEGFQQITNFMNENRLSSEEVSEGFAVMAALKSGAPEDLQAAYDWFVGNTQRLAEALGHQLPEDIRSKVENGLLDEEAAQDLARQRARASLLEQQTRQITEDQQRAVQAQEMQVAQQRMVSAVQSWEEGIKARDPDYASKKAVLVEDQVRAIIQRNGGVSPRSTEEAVALAEQAYGEVNERLKAFLPKPRPVTPPPAGLSARASTQPTTLRGFVEAALNR